MEKLLPDGIKLLIVGQLTVLLFLGCIVLTIKSIAWIIKRFETRADAQEAVEPEPVSADEEESAVAVIAAAMHHNRTKAGL